MFSGAPSGNAPSGFSANILVLFLAAAQLWLTVPLSGILAPLLALLPMAASSRAFRSHQPLVRTPHAPGDLLLSLLPRFLWRARHVSPSFSATC
jgi:hypothetical protein